MPMNRSEDPDPPSSSNLRIPIGSLNSRDFASYGQVIRNPASSAETTHLQKVVANQGSATKWLDVADMTDWYSLAPSKKSARAVFNMFVCAPRALEEDDGTKVFPVKVLERHPYTSQTFIPLGLSAEDKAINYLVIVAPTLRSDSRSPLPKPYPAEKPARNGRSLKDRLLGARPNPYTNDHAAVTTAPEATNTTSGNKPRGPGQPDLDHLQAFIARGDQAVTYAPGTWHAPMVVLGEKNIDFVVVQYANGVPTEDCQELDISRSIVVEIDQARNDASEPGIMRAKL